GANSASSGDLRDYVVPHIADDDVTHILLSVGTNDMKNFHLISRFKREFGTLLYALRTRFPKAKIVWTQIPDMRKFPVLPDGLGRVLAARAALINRKGRQLCAERGAIAADAFPIVDASGFGRDGFHPNDRGYRAWAMFLAPFFVEPVSAKVEVETAPDRKSQS
ncbi:MAG: SGNH/GDSL hydrolase family protein, partial [Ahrensia sp.]